MRTMNATKHGVGVILCLLTAAGVARADGVPSPTFSLDSEYLGFPVGPIVGLALAAAAVAIFVLMSRKRVPKLPAAIACVVLFIAGYVAIYNFCRSIGVPRPPSPPRQPRPWLDHLPKIEKKQEQEKPKAAPESP